MNIPEDSLRLPLHMHLLTSSLSVHFKFPLYNRSFFRSTYPTRVLAFPKSANDCPNYDNKFQKNSLNVCKEYQNRRVRNNSEAMVLCIAHIGQQYGSVCPFLQSFSYSGFDSSTCKVKIYSKPNHYQIFPFQINIPIRN